MTCTLNVSLMSPAKLVICALAISSAPAQGGACDYSSTLIPGPPSGAFVQVQWGGIWGSSCLPHSPEFVIQEDRIDLHFQSGGFGGCWWADTPFCLEPVMTPSVVPPGTYDVHITVTDLGSGFVWFSSLMETLVIEAECAASWLPAFGDRGGFSGAVRTSVAHAVEPGASPLFFVAGEFTEVGGVRTNHIALWNSAAQEWGPVGWTTFNASPFGWLSPPGLGGPVHALASFNDGELDGHGVQTEVLYAAGAFTALGNGAPAGRIATWRNIGGWHSLSSDFDDGEVFALQVFDDGLGDGPALYAGGTFTSVNGAPMRGLARWDGVTWTEVGGGVASGTSHAVRTLAVFDDGTGPALFIGGFFSSAGGQAAKSLAKWNGSQWTDIGAQLGGGFFVWISRLFVVEDVFDDASSLVVCGAFSFLGDPINFSAMVRWNGARWENASPGHAVAAHVVLNDGTGPALYVAGVSEPDFYDPGGSVSDISRWDGTAWSTAARWRGGVYSMDNFDDGLGNGTQMYVGATVGDDSHRVVRFDGAQWTSTVRGIEGGVSDIELFDDGSGDGPAVYVAGAVLTASEIVDNGIARWDGAQWVPVGEGRANVATIKVFDDGAGSMLYTGADRWNGIAWEPTPGIDGSVLALDVVAVGAQAPALHAVGRFWTNGVQNVAVWNGTSWVGVGTGVSNPEPWLGQFATVGTLTAFDDGFGDGSALYIGGWFSLPGVTEGFETVPVARWDGRSWSKVGDIQQTVRRVTALTVFDDGSGAGPALYAACERYEWAGPELYAIKRWDGGQWTVVGLADGPIESLTLFTDSTGSALYAGGSFTLMNGLPAEGIARFNGATWSPLEHSIGGGNQGVSGVKVMKAHGGGSAPALLIAGDFTQSPFGDAHIALWHGCAESDPCAPADLNCDGVINNEDLLLLLSAWGACPDNHNCPADLTGDGVVTMADLLLLMTQW